MKTASTYKQCPKCRNTFQCLGEEDCWCESYQILQKDFIRITQQYNDCLCPTCLKEYTSE